MTPIRSQQELYDLFITVLQDSAPDLTDINEGSDIDILGGVFSVSASELTRLVIDQFSKTFFSLANGPEITGGDDDLQTLAVDHFGDNFARPGAVEAVDAVTFSRANNSGGSVTILAGSVVKTWPDANGNVQRYTTDETVILTNNSSGTDLSRTVAVTAATAGKAGNAAAGTIVVIETSLTDLSIHVTNAGNATGADAQDDATYRETIRNLIEAIAGATTQAIEAKAKTVAGIVTATAIEKALNVIEWDIGGSTTIGTYFRVPRAVLYVADSTGTASVALLQEVVDAIKDVKACGVLISVAAATPITQNWSATLTFNPMGPNNTELESNPQKIKDSMHDYIANLPVGTGFNRATAKAAILAIWGPAGTDDLTDFSTSVPSGEVSATPTEKLIPGAMTIV